MNAHAVPVRSSHGRPACSHGARFPQADGRAGQSSPKCRRRPSSDPRNARRGHWRDERSAVGLALRWCRSLRSGPIVRQPGRPCLGSPGYCNTGGSPAAKSFAATGCANHQPATKSHPPITRQRVAASTCQADTRRTLTRTLVRRGSEGRTLVRGTLCGPISAIFTCRDNLHNSQRLLTAAATTC